MTARTATNDLSSRLDSLTDSVKDLASAGAEKATSIKDSAVDGVSWFASNTAKLVKKHPFATIAIAFGVGYIAMRLVRR